MSAALHHKTFNAARVMRAAREYTALGARVQLYRPSGEGLVLQDGTRRVYVMRNAYGPSTARMLEPNTGAPPPEWTAFAALDVDLRAGDVVTDRTMAFRITSMPTTDQGYLEAEAELTPIPT